MRVALVVAIAENGVIGDKGAMPWRISDDLKWFKKVTLGKPVIMGRKTFESIGKPLPGRRNIVVTRSASWEKEGVIRAAGVDEALRLAAAFAAEDGAEEVCVIGGGEIYAQTLDLAQRIYLTRVAAAVEGDAYFPPLEEGAWRARPAGGCEKSEKNQHSCQFFILDRV
jgi:dihydrofolate reductase